MRIRPSVYVAERDELRDVDLLRRLAAGDEAAFLLFYQRYQPGLFRYALHMSARPEVAADVVQETFMTLLRQAGKFDAARGAPAAFLYGIARNHLRRAQQRESAFLPLEDFEVGGRNGNGNGNGRPLPAGGAGYEHAIEEALEREEAIRMLRAAVASLPLHYREVVALCDLDGKSYDEAAALLECPVGTIRSRLNRARDLLLEKMRPASAAAARPARVAGR